MNATKTANEYGGLWSDFLVQFGCVCKALLACALLMTKYRQVVFKKYHLISICLSVFRNQLKNTHSRLKYYPNYRIIPTYIALIY